MLVLGEKKKVLKERGGRSRGISRPPGVRASTGLAVPSPVLFFYKKKGRKVKKKGSEGKKNRQKEPLFLALLIPPPSTQQQIQDPWVLDLFFRGSPSIKIRRAKGISLVVCNFFFIISKKKNNAEQEQPS